MAITISYEEIAAILAIVFGGGSAATIALKQKGLVTFGKVTERRKFCELHDLMASHIKTTLNEVREITKTVKATTDKINTELNSINIKLAEHIGYHSGKKEIQDNRSSKKRI